MNSQQTAGVQNAELPAMSVGRRYGMLAILTLVGTCNTMDSGIVNILLEPIKLDFHLTDTQVGIVGGLAFALAHAVVAIPLGALADRVSRRNLIAICMAVWSVMTAMCGLAQNFPQLLLARMGVGAGEAGGQAASLSSVSDLFPEGQRATAISIYYLSSPFGAMLAAGVGGLIAASFGWRAALFAAGVPGLLMAIILMIFGRDPPRTARPGQASPAPSFREVIGFVASQRALIHLVMGLALVTLAITGVGSFTPSFFIRYHHMNLRQLGPILGVASGVIGISMMLGSGVLADRLGKTDPRWRLWIVSITLLAATPVLLIAFTISGALALPLSLMNLVVVHVWMGPGFATAQSLTTPRMRSTVAAMMFVVNGLIGFGFGPVIVGALSDGLAKHVGAQSLRWALVIVVLMNVWAALHFFLATRTLRADLARARDADGFAGGAAQR
jgi:MFS family permease